MTTFKSIFESPENGQRIVYFYEPDMLMTGTYYSSEDGNAPFIEGDFHDIVSIDPDDEIWWANRTDFVLDDEFFEVIEKDEK